MQGVYKNFEYIWDLIHNLIDRYYNVRASAIMTLNGTITIYNDQALYILPDYLHWP